MTDLYPKETYSPPTEKVKARRWHVHYHLVYDGGGGAWTGYYRTYVGARIAAWYNYHIASYGGSAKLVENKQY